MTATAAPASRTIAERWRLGRFSPVVPPVTAASSAVYLALIILLQNASFGYGLARSALSIALLGLVAAVFLHPRMSRRHDRSALLVVAAAASLVPLLDAVLCIPTEHHVRVPDGLAISGAILALCALSANRLARVPGIYQTLVLVGLAAVLVIPALDLLSGFVVPKLMDIATTTADAGRAMWSGQNPYAMNLDAYGTNLMHDVRFGGYKYMPLMAAAYLPFVLAIGDNGVLVANLVFYVCTALLVAQAARGFSRQAGPLALLLFVATPVVAFETLAMGATDIAPTLLLVGAATQMRRSSLLTGLLVGLSLSMKLAPAMFAVTLFFPLRRGDWWRYTAGLLLGATPALAYFLWAPGPFIDNIIVFNAARPPNSTSWRYYAPAWAGQLANRASLAAWLGVSLYCVVGQQPARTRLFAYVAVIILIVLAASSSHNNYAIWWTPAFAALLATAGLPARYAEPAKPGQFGQAGMTPASA